MKVLVTGGAGYIGSHFVKVLKNSNLKDLSVAVLDNLSRGHKEAVDNDVTFYQADLLNPEDLLYALKEFKPETVVHFAAFAYVGESVTEPAMYYTNNVQGSLNLIKACDAAGVKNFIFSSTCSVYGNPERVPISEDLKINPINPYAKTKYFIENILADMHTAGSMNYVALRYFNAAGCDSEGEKGESHDPETHLIPIILQVALGEREKVTVFGDDYDTPDGTCIRDYVHVEDIASAHLYAIDYLNTHDVPQIINLGTGDGNSVLEIINKTEAITGKKIKYELGLRRAGDPAVLVADNKKAKEVLNWEPKHNIESIIETAWNWFNNKKY